MPADPPPQHPDADDPRTRPRAVREIAGMFDQVSDRYDFLNRVMTLGRDGAWREAMAREVPESARAVLDLCCGSGVSLAGLRRPGRLVIGIDASIGMLEIAADSLGRSGWAPRLVCADAFRLPLRDRALDAVTIAFGIRNLRPRSDALAEIARALRPGGLLVVLEATAPHPGAMRPFHSFYLRRLIPLAGRLSPDPSAYAYLARSIQEFGAGPEFEADLAGAGFELCARRAFLFGATRLWTARRTGAVDSRGAVQRARLGDLPRGEMPHRPEPGGGEWRVWAGVKFGLSAVVLAALVFSALLFARAGEGLVLEPWQRSWMRILLGAAIAAFVIRTLILAIRFLGPPSRR